MDKYKAVIYESYFSSRRKGPKHYAARRALNEFKKLAVNQEAIADLYFYYAHMALLYVQESGSKKIADSERVTNAYRQSLELVVKLGVEEEYRQKALEFLDRKDGLAYPYGQDMEEIYEHYFSQRT